MTMILRSLLLTCLFLLPLQGESTKIYTVKLAVYKNLDTLKEKLQKLPPALRNTVEVRKDGEFYRATTIYTTDEKTLTTLLPAYKLIFSDAHVATVK
ncbi:MAG TPA: hypothetical protein EYH42_07270 [Sulfurovum sp.]|nr:hypothetical protein [Sulfurovum sp.]